MLMEDNQMGSGFLMYSKISCCKKELFYYLRISLIRNGYVGKVWG